MKAYFQLQFVMANRKLREAGINPALAYIMGVAAFVLISGYLFQLTGFASYLVILAALGVLLNLSDKNRSDFLHITFGAQGKRKLRTAENLTVALPFILVLVFHGAYFETIALFVLSIVLAAFSFRAGFNFTMPTPFSRHPFEFAVGFRKTFYLFPIAYALSIIAVKVDNLNLGIFAMLLVFLIAMSYYAKPENEYYVWVYACTPARFLFSKLKRAAINVVLLNLPVLPVLLFFFPDEYRLILIFFLVGLLFLMTIILAKYSAYPQEMNIPKGILIAFSVYFPPFLLVLMPFFYLKSVKKLKVFLDDQN